MKHHIPVVKLVTPKPDEHGITPAILTRLTVDDREWAVTHYSVDGDVDGIQEVTLSFLADVTIGHEPLPPLGYADDLIDPLRKSGAA